MKKKTLATCPYIVDMKEMDLQTSVCARKIPTNIRKVISLND